MSLLGRVGTGHCFGNMRLLATMPSKFHQKKLEWASDADRLKFNGRVVQINLSWIGQDIVAFVCSSLGNFCELRKLQTVQTYKIGDKTSSWHRDKAPHLILWRWMYKSQRWHHSESYVHSWANTNFMVNHCHHDTFVVAAQKWLCCVWGGQQYHTYTADLSHVWIHTYSI